MITYRSTHLKGFALTLTVFFAAALPAASNAQDISKSPAFTQYSDDILNNPLTPAMGNTSGDVTIIEYFDFLCHYCKDEEAGLEKLLQEDGNLKIIYKVSPKHGPLSVTAAIASLASVRQGTDKYQAFHDALMNVDIASEDTIYQVASSVGLDVTKLKQDMADKSLSDQVQDNINVGQNIGVHIVPTFIIGGYFFPGDSGYDKLKQMVAYVRSKGNG